MFLFNFVYYVFLLLCTFRSRYCISQCCSVYCLCVNVYCTTATGCQTNCSYQIYHIILSYILPIISYHIISYHIISYHIIYHIISYHIISYHISYHIISYTVVLSSVMGGLQCFKVTYCALVQSAGKYAYVS